MKKIIIEDELIAKAEKVRQASAQIQLKSTAQKNRALTIIANHLLSESEQILAANQKDIAIARQQGMNQSLIDRLLLTPERIQGMSNGLKQLTALHDPIGDTLEQWTRPNGLIIQKTRVPLGVVGMVYEARPNVTVDAAGLCLKTGNAVYLRGSSSALESNKALVAVIHHALQASDLPVASVMLLEDTRHDTADRFFHLNGYLDVLIPRGSKRLIQTVVQKASVPVLETGAGNCHLFIDASAQPDMALSIALNAKTQRPSVCNTIETIIIHEKWLAEHGDVLIQSLTDAGVECRIDPSAAPLFPDLPVADANDWATEYLDKIIAIKIVTDVNEAIRHINRYSTRHSEAIITENQQNVRLFFQSVDASTLYHNASTRFTDGEMFGFGAEIGISTQKLHARGPMGLNALTTIKYLVEGNGQIRN
ncbi:glutamate-5-semialdehyde dehydrogenase [Sporolactobacillus spathodeae]|uniref:Gamma-glutamyl phosphate reductase n=1 Tax=Sporolactobacillus spathodeae TaxID=1465502 RepID=A0ABS2Q800_9BACL|nr:glutamate-5-semialdehyde dehydrogenase [Sporolactobacillus spathodeae]MBM7657910.1 glutamate-5-semialdehyde dehydrogenase [Sporolactobacillus spathodeae]